MNGNVLSYCQYYNRVFEVGKCLVKLGLPLTGLPVDGAIAFTGSFFQSFAILNVNDSARIGNEPSLLQDAGGDGDAGAAGGQHVGQKFLSERYDVTAKAILGHQQPPAETLFDFMQAVARGDLGSLQRKFLRKAVQADGKFWIFLKRGDQLFSAYPEPGARYLHNDAHVTAGKTCQQRHTHDTFATAKSDFDALSSCHHV
jgi:hypothetical protein